MLHKTAVATLTEFRYRQPKTGTSALYQLHGVAYKVANKEQVKLSRAVSYCAVKNQHLKLCPALRPAFESGHEELLFPSIVEALGLYLQCLEILRPSAVISM